MNKFDEAALRSRRERLMKDNPKMPSLTVPSWANSTAHIPSHPMTGGDTSLKPVPKYTGDKIIGIATMHKSNAVPVVDKEQAVSLAKMRRS